MVKPYWKKMHGNKGRSSDASPFLPAHAQRRDAAKFKRRTNVGSLVVKKTTTMTTTTTKKKNHHQHTTLTTTRLPKPNSAAPDATQGRHRIEKHEIAQLPSLAWQGRVHVLSDRAQMQAAVAGILQNETLLGFDTETKPCFSKGQYNPPALVQVAGANAVYIFQILHTGLDVLVPLWQAKHILKVGVAIHQDVKELQREHQFHGPAGFVELAERTRALGYEQAGLRSLTALLLGGCLNKKQQMSNWAKPVLSPQQVQYAATDAWVGRELYLQVLQQEEEKKMLGSNKE